MRHFPYAELGKGLIEGSWGIEAPAGAMSDVIKQTTTEQDAVCLLAWIAQQLSEIRQAASASASASMPKPDEQPSAGMLRAWLLSMGDTSITPEMTRGLSARSRRAILQAGIKLVSEITPERLEKVPNCGASTIRELMELRNRYLGETPKPVEPSA